MKRTIITLISLFLIGNIFAQETKNLKVISNSESIIRGALQLTEKGQYDEAIKEYNKIPLGDVNYETAQYEKAYAMEVNKDYVGAINILNKLLENPQCSVSSSNICTELGNCYDYIGQHDKAVESYDKAIAEYPYYYHLYFNKGVTLMGMGKYTEALECFKTSIFLNPAHQGSHYRYGLCYLKMGYTIPGILALNYCTLINPSTQYTIEALRELDAIYSNGVKLYNEDNKIEIDPKYEELNEYYSKITTVLNTTFTSLKQFHNLSKIDHRVVKSNQVVFTNIQPRPGSHEIEDQLYAPLFAQLMSEKKFNTLSYYQFSNTDIENGKVTAKAQKMEGQIHALVLEIVSQMKNAASNGLGKENKEGYYYQYSDNITLLSWGKLDKSNPNNPVEDGTWHSLTQYGQLEAIANYKQGQYDGLVQIFENGVISQEANFKDGKIKGVIHLYTVDPITKEKVPSLITELENNQLNGIRQEFNEAGIMITDGQGSDGGYEGEVKYYNEQGVFKGFETYKDGEIRGHIKSLYDNGQTEYEYIVGGKDEKTNYTSFYPTGKIQGEGQIMNGNRVGSWRYYYPDGTVSSVQEYDDNGKKVGTWTEYNPNKTISCIGTYQNDKVTDVVEYSNYGKPRIHITYKNGQIVSLTTLNPDSTVRENIPIKNKVLTYDTYTDNGWKISTQSRNINNELTGKSILYHSNGTIAREIEYANGAINGSSKSYYNNGKLKDYVNYKDGHLNGLCVLYYNNDDNSIAEERYYRNDTMVNAYYSYFMDGKIKKIDIYNNEGKHVHDQAFYSNGNLKLDAWYCNGLIYIVKNYNPNGELIASDTFHFGKGTIKQYYGNGSIYNKTDLLGGLQNNYQYFYDFNNNLVDSIRIINNKADGSVKSNFSTGEISYEYGKVLDYQEGIEKSYDYMGKLYAECLYVNNCTEGIRKVYTFDGKLYREQNYVNDERDGKSLCYAPDGKAILYVYEYEDGELVSYSYSQKDGSMSKAQLMTNEPLQITAYYPNGKVGAVVNYKNGLLDGSLTYYYPNGQAYETSEYKNGKILGEEITYYPNGKIYSKINYRNSAYDGITQYFFENGQLAKEIFYTNGMANGEFKQYDKTGKLIRKGTIFDDIIQEETRY
ncbi:MAG: tetratricopeptide repeat protein [Bacteroidales bacterium]|nr:tetratricopeptide repeat protein [Bacteroidales bacterium]